jgi:hypothetical protein
MKIIGKIFACYKTLPYLYIIKLKQNIMKTTIKETLCDIAFIALLLSLAVLLFTVATAGYLFSNDTTLFICCTSAFSIAICFVLVFILGM